MTQEYRKLFVVLEGMFVFFEGDTQIEAQIVNMGTEHVYLAGDWLCETDLAPGDYTLDNVSLQECCDTFCSTKNLVFADVGSADGADSVRHARLTFPRPRKIHSLFGHPYKSAKFLFGGENPVEEPTEVASVQVFEYELGQDDMPQLTPVNDRTRSRMGAMHWKARAADSAPQNVVLHIHAEPPQIMEDPEASAHVLRAWNTGGLLFDSLGAVMLQPYQADANQTCVPMELLVNEFLDLPTRDTSVCNLGILTRQIFTQSSAYGCSDTQWQAFCEALKFNWPPADPAAPSPRLEVRRPGCTMGAISTSVER